MWPIKTFLSDKFFSKQLQFFGLIRADTMVKSVITEEGQATDQTDITTTIKEADCMKDFTHNCE